MTAQNSVNRILINADGSVENEFDRCLIETELGDVFVLMCFPHSEQANKYSVYIFKTAIYVGDISEVVGDEGEEDDDPVARVIDLSNPVYAQSFYAANPMCKRGLLSDMLQCIKEDDADTWQSLKGQFGCEDVSTLRGNYGQVAIC